MTTTNANQPPARKGPAGTSGSINAYHHKTNVRSTTLLNKEKTTQKSENTNSHKNLSYQLNSAPVNNQQSILKYIYHTSPESAPCQTTEKINQRGAAPLPEKSGMQGDATDHLKLERPSLTNYNNLVNATAFKNTSVPTRFVKSSKSSTQPVITKFLTKTPSTTAKDLPTDPTQVKGRPQQRPQQVDQPFPLPLQDSYPIGSKPSGSNDDPGPQDRKPTKGHSFLLRQPGLVDPLILRSMTPTPFSRVMLSPDALSSAAVASGTSCNPPIGSLPQTIDETIASDYSQHPLQRKPIATDYGAANTKPVPQCHELLLPDNDDCVELPSTEQARGLQAIPLQAPQSSRCNAALSVSQTLATRDPPLIAINSGEGESSGINQLVTLDCTGDQAHCISTEYSVAEAYPKVVLASSGTGPLPKPATPRKHACPPQLQDHSLTLIQTGNDRLESRAAPPRMDTDRTLEPESRIHTNLQLISGNYWSLHTPPCTNTTLPSVSTPIKPTRKGNENTYFGNLVADNLLSNLNIEASNFKNQQVDDPWKTKQQKITDYFRKVTAVESQTGILNSIDKVSVILHQKNTTTNQTEVHQSPHQEHHQLPSSLPLPSRRVLQETTALSVGECTGMHASVQFQDTPGKAPTIDSHRSPQLPKGKAMESSQQGPRQLFFHDEAQQAIRYDCHRTGKISPPPSYLHEGDKISTSASPQTPLPRSQLHHLPHPVLPRDESIRTLPISQEDSNSFLSPSCINDHSTENALEPDNRTVPMPEPHTNTTTTSTDAESQTYGVRENITSNNMMINQCTQAAPIRLSPPTATFPPKNRTKTGYRRYLLKYIDQPTNQRKISYFHSASPSYNLQDSWGHSLESIDASSTFRIFLQNPNGLSLYDTNFSLMKDLETCQTYGAAVISLPETNVNWELPGQRNTLTKILSRNFDHTSVVTSRASEPFHSSYQPGGTATIVCNNWTSRIISKGSDPHGLGRWSYVILRGKGTTKVALITAYNVSQRYQGNTGERTAYKQQHRLLSQIIRENNLQIAPHPHRQFILDLQAWVEHLISTNHEIILSLDANEPYNPDIPANTHTLSYESGKLTQDKTHDGKLATLIATCGLQDPLARQHPERPFPASYFRGKNRIDYILVTPRLTSAVLRTGSLPLYSLFQGDHRPYYIDLDATVAFEDSAYEISRPQGRGLQLKDPRVVAKYTTALYEQLEYHKIWEKEIQFKEVANSGKWTQHHTEQYQRVDTNITEIMLSAERKAGRRYSTKFDWSPALKKAVQEYRFWKLKLKKTRGLKVSFAVLTKYHSEADLPAEMLTRIVAEAEVVKHLQGAYKNMTSHQKNHKQLRATYLESLAEAIVLHRSPLLDRPEAASLKHESKLKQIKQLQKRENYRRMYMTLGNTLNPGETKGLSRVDVPDERAKGSDLGSPDDPKHWKGPWRSITNPEDIAKTVCEINRKQYNQAWETPFGSGPLATSIGRLADTPAAEALLQGNLPTNILSSLMPETIRLLQTIATPTTPVNQSSTITEEEFIATYKRAQENTSSSPSGRHVGHYKAILKDPNLVSLHTTMMNIPFQVGITPDRWTRVTDIMLEKDAGSARCHRLRILALFESDFNHAKRILIARKVGHHLEDNNLASNMQHGSRPGKNCHSAVLQKVLSHDIVRLQHTTAAFIENDAVGCYDRLMNNLLLLILLRLGMDRNIAKCMGSVWDQTVHHIKTVYGTSSTTYYSTPQVPLFGPGQGSTCGPIFWLLCFCLIVDSIDPDITAAVFASVSSQIVVSTLGAAFVDDTSLSVTSSYNNNPDLTAAQNATAEVSHTVEQLATLGQHWEKLLFSTGGAINMQKSFWYLMAWTWKNGQAKLVTANKTMDTLELTAGYSAQKQRVPKLDTRDSFRTLGIYISPSGSQTKQAKVLRQHAEDYKQQIVSSNLNQIAAYYSYMQYIRPRLTYPLPCSFLTQQQCRHIQAPALAALLPKMHLNQHTPHAVLFGEPRYGGLNLPDLYTDQGFGQLRLLLGHLRSKDDIGQLILIAISHLQLRVGSAKPFFVLPYPHYAKWLEKNWLTSIWKHTVQLRMQVEIEHHWLPTLQRENDIMLMDFFMTLNFSPSQIKIINSCRLFLQVFTLSDITAADGKAILPNYIKGQPSPDRISSLKWPKQIRPPIAAWKLWQTAIAHISTNGTLHRILGKWKTKPHQKWTWFHHKSQHLVYHLGKEGEWKEFSPVVHTSGNSRTTRQTKIWYSLGAYRMYIPSLTELFPATIYQDPLYDEQLFYVTYSVNTIPETFQSAEICSLWDLDNSLHVLADTPEFYQRLIGPLPGLEDHNGLEIAHNIELDTLLVCSDGSHSPESHTGSHGWVIANNDKKLLLQGAGPVDGHPKLTSSYRSELGGLLAVLYTIYRICQYYQVTGGKVTYHCDNKGVLNNVFSPTPPGISPYLQPDEDLLMEVKRLLNILPVTIVAQWVKGHYTGKDREYKHDLNDIADSLATSFNRRPHPQYVPKAMPIVHKHFGARIIYEGSTITKKLHPLMAQALHRDAIISHILRKTKWTDRIFQSIHWDAHELAFKRLSRSRQISTAKLIHGLVNTNVQNQRYYNKSPLCPCCLTENETFDHVLSCSSEAAVSARTIALKELRKNLQQINTPLEVIEALIHGTNIWLNKQGGECAVRPLTAGSLKGTDMLLTTAFNEQFHSIGWSNLFHGRLSQLWGKTVSQINKSPFSSYSTTWAAQTILYLWQYTRVIWEHRNQVVHGATDQEKAARIKQAIDQQVRDLYSSYQNNPDFILTRHQYLFTSKSLEQRLKLDIDSITCWIRSVESAQQDLAHHNTNIRLQSSRFFAPFYAIGRARQQTTSSSADSTYSPSLQDSSSMYDTDSLSSTFLSEESDTLSVTTSSTSFLGTTTSTSSLGTFITTGSSDPPSIISWSTSSEQS